MREGYWVHTSTMPMLKAMFPDEFDDLVIRYIVDVAGFCSPLAVSAPEYWPEDGAAALARARGGVRVGVVAIYCPQ